MEDADRIDEFNKLLNAVPIDDFKRKQDEENIKNEEEFQALRGKLKVGECLYCGRPIRTFIESEPCLHWFLNPRGFKKKLLPKLIGDKGFHQIQAYLRWVANAEDPVKNINDLVEDEHSNKVIEETIRYKNLEWSFSCSKGCYEGLPHKHEGQYPHYHFQMRVSGNVMINYSGFHIPFNDYDFFCFAVKDGKFDRLRAKQVHGAGMSSIFDDLSEEELMQNMQSAENEDEAQFSLDTLLIAEEGKSISGDVIADLMEKSKKTGIPMAKLLQEIELDGVHVTTSISPGPGVPDKAKRTQRGKMKAQ